VPGRTQRREKSLDFIGSSFVTVVSFVFEKWYPVKNGRADVFYSVYCGNFGSDCKYM
jgi:hypothetical protein